MATLTRQTVDRDGVQPSYTSAAAGGDQWANGGRDFLHVKNGDASSHTVTVASQRASFGQGAQKKDVAVSIPAGEERIIGPFSKGAFNDSDDNAQITYDAVTSVTIGVFKLS